MIKTLPRALLTATLLLFTGIVGARAQTITDSPHDLSIGSATPTPSTSGAAETCVFCHTPHFTADPNTAPAPLWNRAAPVSTSFTMYSSSTLDMTVAADPQGVSLACLSCHDGATAFDSLLNEPVIFAAGNAVMANSVTAVGADGLANDHPVSISYDTSLDGGFVAPVAGRIADTLPLFRAAGVTTGDGTQVECASCHDSHDWSSNGSFLRVSNAGSNLCKTCHIK